MNEDMPKEIQEEEISIETSDGRSIEDFNKEAVEEIIVEELIEQGFSEDDVEELAEIGAEMLLNEKDNEAPNDAPPPHLSTPKKLSEYQEKIEEAKIEGKPSISEEITARERLNANKEGLEAYAETLQKKLDEYADDDFSKDKYYYRHQLDKVTTQIDEINEQLDNLPNDPKETPIEEYPEWQQDLILNERMAKRSRLGLIKDLAAAGIEMNGKFGMDAIGEVNNEYDKLITLARFESKRAEGTYKAKEENKKESTEDDPFEDYNEYDKINEF